MTEAEAKAKDITIYAAQAHKKYEGDLLSDFTLGFATNKVKKAMLDQIAEIMKLRKKEKIRDDGISKAEAEMLEIPIYKAKPLKVMLIGDLFVDFTIG